MPLRFYKEGMDAQFGETELGSIYFGHVSATPTDSDIGEGNTAFYAKADGDLYKRPYGGSESRVGGGSSGSFDHLLSETLDAQGNDISNVGSLQADGTHVAEQLDIPVYSDDTNAPDSTHFFNDSEGVLKYKDASGAVHEGSSSGSGGGDVSNPMTTDLDAGGNSITNAASVDMQSGSIQDLPVDPTDIANREFVESEVSDVDLSGVDVSELSGAGGEAGQVPQTDGTNIQWADIEASGFDHLLSETLDAQGNDISNVGSLQITEQLDIPVYSDDATAPNATHFFNDTESTLKYKDASGAVHESSGSGGDGFDHALTESLDAQGNDISNVGSVAMQSGSVQSTPENPTDIANREFVESEVSGSSGGEFNHTLSETLDAQENRIENVGSLQTGGVSVTGSIGSEAYSDTFDTDTSSEWTIISGTLTWETENSRIEMDSSTRATINQPDSGSGVYTATIISDETSLGNIGVIWAVQDEGTYYHARLHPGDGEVQIWRFEGGSPTNIGSRSVDITPGTPHTLSAVWSEESGDIEIYLDSDPQLSSPIITTQDTVLGAGGFGIRSYDGSGYIESFSFEPPSSATTITDEAVSTTSLQTDGTQIAEQLDIPVYSDDATAPDSTHFFNDADGALKYKDASGTVHASSGWNEDTVSNPMATDLDAGGNSITNADSVAMQSGSVQSAPVDPTDIANREFVEGEVANAEVDMSEVDVSELSGAAGVSGQVPQTDGTNVQWADIDTGGFDHSLSESLDAQGNDISNAGSIQTDEAEIASDSQWKNVATVTAGSGVSSFDIDLSSVSYDVYRVEFMNMAAGGSSSSLWMRFDGLADARYQYVSEGTTRNRATDATEMEVSEEMRSEEGRGVTGRLDIYTDGRVHVVGNVASGHGVDDATLLRGVHYDVADDLDTITFLTPPGDAIDFDADATVVVAGRDLV